MRNPGDGRGPVDPARDGRWFDPVTGRPLDEAGYEAGRGDESGTTILPRPGRPPLPEAAGHQPMPEPAHRQPMPEPAGRPPISGPNSQTTARPTSDPAGRPRVAGPVPHGQVGFGQPPLPPYRPPVSPYRSDPSYPPSQPNQSAPLYQPSRPTYQPSRPTSQPSLPRPPYQPPYQPAVGSGPASPYAQDGPDSRTQQLPRPTHPPERRGSHLPPYSGPSTPRPDGSRSVPDPAAATGGRSPRKLTVTRVAALRSRELTLRGARMFHRATTADGADESGLAHLTYAVMANYAVDAALAVALANTLFFAAAKAESTGKVLLYLVITVAPFAVIAPFIGPLLDRLQHGRRLALALSSFGRALLAVVMALDFNSNWVLYPCALGNLVLSKAFGVLKSSLTPRVLPKQITLVKTNSRLTVFGLVAGGVAGALAAGFAKVTGSPGALFFTAACAVVGGWLCFRIPAWVESTEGEVPLHKAQTGQRKGFPPNVVAALWSNSTIRVETGFLALFMAFVIKSQYADANGFKQLLLLGVVGAAAGAGGFVGNALGARLNLSAPEKISLFSLGAVVLAAVIAALAPGLPTAAVVGLVGSTASSLAKVCLDSTIQFGLPEASRASAFGVSESVLQLAWVFGGVLGLLIGGVWSFGHASVYTIGFAVISALLILGTVQSTLINAGRSMLPGLKLRRKPDKPAAGPAPLGSAAVVGGPGLGGEELRPPVRTERPRRKTRIAGKDD